MIGKILLGIINLIIKLVTILLRPIELLIEQFLPDLDSLFDMVASLVQMLTNIVPWVMSWFGLNLTIRTMVVSYFTFILTVPILVHTIKLAIKWYDKLKP